MTILTWLLALGLEIQVAILPAQLLGVACHPDFRAIEGHAQELCPTSMQEGVVLSPMALATPQLRDHVLLHEWYHLQHRTPGPPGDLFREEEAHRFACVFIPVERRC